MRIRRVTLIEVEYIAFEMARKWMTWNEPIPDFGTRFPRVLESCVAAPFQTFDQKPLYKKLSGKAAVLFYLMIKNHPFENGNKRVAVMTLLIFLYRNRKWIEVSNEDLYNFAVGIAKSDAKKKGYYIAHIEAFIAQNMVAIPR